jgi:hypothetical protein
MKNVGEYGILDRIEVCAIFWKIYGNFINQYRSQMVIKVTTNWMLPTSLWKVQSIKFQLINFKWEKFMLFKEIYDISGTWCNFNGANVKLLKWSESYSLLLS